MTTVHSLEPSILPTLTESVNLNERLATTRMVFRVFDDQSHTAYSPGEGFSAPVTDPVQNTQAINDTVKGHLDWDCQTPSPWISTTRRWLWALWEMKCRVDARRGHHSHTNVRIALIDLDVCRKINTRLAITGAIDCNNRCTHALSGLPNVASSSGSSMSDFANMADEILILNKIPSEAIVSVVHENAAPLFPVEFKEYLLDKDNHFGFRDLHWKCASRLSNKTTWNPVQRGRLCADTALLLLQDVYTQLPTQILYLGLHKVCSIISLHELADREQKTNATVPEAKSLFYSLPVDLSDALDIHFRLPKPDSNAAKRAEGHIKAVLGLISKDLYELESHYSRLETCRCGYCIKYFPERQTSHPSDTQLADTPGSAGSVENLADRVAATSINNSREQVPSKLPPTQNVMRRPSVTPASDGSEQEIKLMATLSKVIERVSRTMSKTSATSEVWSNVTMDILEEMSNDELWTLIVFDGKDDGVHRCKELAPVIDHLASHACMIGLWMRVYRSPSNEDSDTAPTRTDLLKLVSGYLDKLFPRLEDALITAAQKKIEEFRLRALEMAGTIPLGLVGRVSKDDWRTMREQMIRTIGQVLVPCERVIKSFGQDHVNWRARTEKKWMNVDESQEFPGWWEESGMRAGRDPVQFVGRVDKPVYYHGYY